PAEVMCESRGRGDPVCRRKGELRCLKSGARNRTPSHCEKLRSKIRTGLPCVISMTHLIWYDAPMSLDGMYDSLPINTEVSCELAHKILRLELRIEQVIIHLRSLHVHH